MILSQYHFFFNAIAGFVRAAFKVCQSTDKKPFYTTKPYGTGIGLSLSKQIMVKHNGTLILKQSDQNQTIFTMVFK